ncbi:MAG: TRAP transporter small permease [Kiloniellales bacterium]|nr:TRAP transporter small permease [Kiloniellales bacterium]
MLSFGRRLRPILDFVYNLCGGIGAIFLLLILCIIVVQMVARWTGFTVPGSTDYAGYAMAGASFFAMAYALNHGAHIRVSLFLSRLGHRRRWAELWCFGIGTVLAGYFAYYAIKGTYWSFKLNDISQGQDATPLWIPQLSMAVGVSVLALALADHFCRILFGGTGRLGDQAAADQHSE